MEVVIGICFYFSISGIMMLLNMKVTKGITKDENF